MSNLISREAILKHIEKTRQDVQFMDDIQEASIIMNGTYLCEEAVRNQTFDGSKAVWNYCEDVTKSIKEKNPLLCAPYDGLYIPVLITCLLINEARR